MIRVRIRALHAQLNLSPYQRAYGRLLPSSSCRLKRFAKPDEVAAMIVYLCSEAASATTGAALRVDGGVVRAVV